MDEMRRRHLALGCAALGIALTDAQAAQFAVFDAMLSQANTRMDLTAVLDPIEAIDRHYIDSLTPLMHPEWLPVGAQVVDVGSGAGFPGIPLAIARPDIALTLIDAQQKRVGFLCEVIDALHLRATAVHLRAEDAGQSPEHRERYDVAVSRAVAGLPTLLELTLPLVRVGGRAISWKGPAVHAEMERAHRAAALLGGALQGPFSAPVPGRDWQHTLVLGDKVRETVRQYPRKAGLPTRKPLGTVS